MSEKCMLNKHSRNCEDFSKCHKCGWNKDVFSNRKANAREKLAKEKLMAQANKEGDRKRKWVFIEL